MPSQRGGPNGNAARTRDGRTLATSSGLEVREHMTPGADPEHGQAADLLSKWRAAERDTIAAKEAAQVASLAHRAATAAETSAVETEEAAVSAAEVVDLARVGAMKARKAASAAAAAAHMAIASAEGDKVRAALDVEVAQAAEDKAREAFRAAQQRGFAEDA